MDDSPQRMVGHEKYCAFAIGVTVVGIDPDPEPAIDDVDFLEG